MTYTIQDLRDGKCAVVNDGTVAELNRVLNFAIPGTGEAWGLLRFYSRYRGAWSVSNTTSLPTQSVHEFLKQL